MRTNENSKLSGGHRRGFLGGATILELLLTMSIFGLTVVVVVSSHIVGLKMYNISATKLSASAGARVALNQVRQDVRSAKLLYVGFGGESYFSNAPTGSQQVGNALQIYPTVNTNSWVRYYMDEGTQTLRRRVSNGSGAEVVTATVTNYLAFQAETPWGTVLTNINNHRVVRMLLEFYQWEFPVAQVGGYYDYYRLQTKVTRRAIE